MPLLGPAAIVISFDIERAAIAEHDEWHSREHMPERLSIPGFRRGSRWKAESGNPEYLVLYEVSGTDVLDSAAYLQRLNKPTAWTTAMMKHYLNMTRSLCRVVESAGQGLGGCVLLARFSPAEEHAGHLRTQLAAMLPSLVQRRGIIAAHLLESAVTATMTTEQKIRGQDADLRFSMLVVGYDHHAVAELLQTDFGPGNASVPGASGSPFSAVYRLAAALGAED